MVVVIDQDQALGVPAATSIGQKVVITLDIMQGAAAKLLVFPTDSNDIPVKGNQLLVFFAPGICASVVRVSKAAHPRLVAR